MPLVIVSKIAYQHMFQLSVPGVPRTFVEDCRYLEVDKGTLAGFSVETHGFMVRNLWAPLKSGI